MLDIQEISVAQTHHGIRWTGTGILELIKTPGSRRTGGQLNLVAGARFKTYLITVPLAKIAA